MKRVLLWTLGLLALLAVALFLAFRLSPWPTVMVIQYAFGKGDAASEARLAKHVPPGIVTRTDIPVLMTTAEWDNARYTKAYAGLLHELVTEHGVMPRYLQSLGHNHSSQLLSLGTADQSVASILVDFIERTRGR